MGERVPLIEVAGCDYFHDVSIQIKSIVERTHCVPVPICSDILLALCAPRANFWICVHKQIRKHRSAVHFDRKTRDQPIRTIPSFPGFINLYTKFDRFAIVTACDFNPKIYHNQNIELSFSREDTRFVSIFSDKTMGSAEEWNIFAKIWHLRWCSKNVTIFFWQMMINAGSNCRTRRRSGPRSPYAFLRSRLLM